MTQAFVRTLRVRKRPDERPSKPVLAGAELLLRDLSPDEQAKIDLEIYLAQCRRYDEWLAGLQISKRHQDLVRALDETRKALVRGRPIDPKLAKAIEVDAGRRKRERKKVTIRDCVDFLAERAEKKLPKSNDPTRGDGAFEVVGRLFAIPPLSAERVRNIYYEKPSSKKKLPRKKKRRS